VLSIDNGANSSAYGNGVTPRMVFEGRATQAPSASIVAFRDALEEATAGARQTRARKEANADPASNTAPTTPGTSVQPIENHNPATTTPLPDASPAPASVKP